MKIALYFGSFNPIHVGHLIIANHVLTHCDVDRLWFVVSPHNPLKETASLLNENHRLHLVQLAIENEPKFKASNIEFKLPRPSFTIDTMTYLREKFPQHEFVITMGSDSFSNIKKWKNYKQLLDQHKIIIYNRPGFDIETSLSKQIETVNAPLLDISSTYIRSQIKEKKSIRYLVTDEVMNEIKSCGYYR
ncbi:MAG: nicotinate-nucleotide adenylyltransferase [Bacteroidetes bacterium]|nr:nicotinate-nucleotide adenylyltransferase [Bacteroidota bacterium]MBK8144120.1 nicotinate-nucleotide adenylyltransferase [Bacteroidota bacterium]MBP6315870.1 nicotinate-nucleotide adenylyltransferase [Chitinophagaceae bacterium]